MLKALAIVFALAASAQAAHATPIAVETVGGHKVVLRDVVIGDDAGLEVRGWARRAPGRPGVIAAHLRIEAFDAAGASLGVTHARWNGALFVRDLSAARFSVQLPQTASTATRVRVSVEGGVLR